MLVPGGFWMFGGIFRQLVDVESVRVADAREPGAFARTRTFATRHSASASRSGARPFVVHRLTAACAAWTMVRMVRLPKLEKADTPQPMGFSRRGQLLDTITTSVNCSQQSHSLPSLTSWLASVSDALRARWPHLPSAQPFYPAFQSRTS